MQQQRAAEDRVMFDAYQNGGLIDGKPVTDGMFLAYLRDRRDSIDKEDPLWEEWNNRVIQQTFNIAESKIITAFRQGKVGSGAVAAFYRAEMAKVPQNSQVWRDMAQSAAQWAEAAGSGAARAASGRAVNDIG